MFSPRRAPLRLGEGSKKGQEHTRDLAWARCSLAQKAELVAWATFRAKSSRRVPIHLA